MVKKIFTALLFILCFPVLFLTVCGEELGISAQSAIVIEKDSGRILYQKNAEKQLPMASTTKIMTAIIALEQGNPTEKIRISPAAAAVEGSSMYLKEGEEFTLEELLYGLMLSSGNDAAVAIAEHLGGMNGFVEQMNQKASVLGAVNTHFANPNGLPDDTHYSTARDMAVITAYCLNNPKFAEIAATKARQISGEGKAHPRSLTNHNKLLQLCPGCIGVKTGFTKAAGRCLVSAAQRNGMTLICVTLNAPNDWNDHCSLYDAMFQTYRLQSVLQAGKLLGEIEISNSETTALPISCPENFSYPLKENEHCVTALSLAPPLDAPVSSGTEVGTITVRLGQEDIASLPLKVCGSAEKQSEAKKFTQNLIRNFSMLCYGWLTLLNF